MHMFEPSIKRGSLFACANGGAGRCLALALTIALTIESALQAPLPEHLDFSNGMANQGMCYELRQAMCHAAVRHLHATLQSPMFVININPVHIGIAILAYACGMILFTAHVHLCN